MLLYKYSQLWALRPEVFLHLLNCLIMIHIGGGTIVEVNRGHVVQHNVFHC